MTHTYSDLITRFDVAHPTNYGGIRAISKIKYIVIHYTGNDGDSDEGNINYFKSPNRRASAHFFVDDDSISQSVPITNVAWHCGGDKYKNSLGGSMYKIVTNTNSIGIEICDTKRDGTYNISIATKRNVIKLVRALMDDFNVPIENIVRHYDVTGKHCPRYYVDDVAWAMFKQEISIHKNETSTFRVKILVDLNIRKQPTVNSDKVGCITDRGVYTIVDMKNGWGKLKSGVGWISLNEAYVRRL